MGEDWGMRRFPKSTPETIAAARAHLKSKGPGYNPTFAEVVAAWPHGKVPEDSVGDWVYFITDGEAIKVGSAMVVEQRRGDLQISHHRELVVLAQMPGGVALERTLHRRWKDFRIRGEWFRDVPEIRLYMATGGMRRRRKAKDEWQRRDWLRLLEPKKLG